MSSFWIVFSAVFPIYLAGAVGIGARLTGILNTQADTSLMRLTVNLLIPSLILKALLNNPAATDPLNLLLAPALGFGSLMIGYALCAWAAKGLKLDTAQRGTFAFVVGTYNYGYIALPIVMTLFGQATLGVLFVYNLGIDIGLWTVGMMLLRGGNWRSSWRQIFSVPVMAVFLGVTLNLTHIAPLIPAVLLKSLEFLGNCAVPLALILTGAIVCDFRRELSLCEQVGSTVAGVLLRIVLIPLLFILTAKFLPMSNDLQRVLIVQAAMPAAMLPIVLTKLHGGDIQLALRQVVVTSIISFMTIPLVIHFGLNYCLTNLNPKS